MISWTAMAKVIGPKGSLGDLSYPFGFGIANCISVIHRSKPFVVLNGMVAFRYQVCSSSWKQDVRMYSDSLQDPSLKFLDCHSLDLMLFGVMLEDCPHKTILVPGFGGQILDRLSLFVRYQLGSWRR